MLRNIKIGDNLLTRGGEIVVVSEVDTGKRFPVRYTHTSGDNHDVSIEGHYYGASQPNKYDIVKIVTSELLQLTKADNVSEIPDSPKPIIDIIDPTIYSTDSATAESLTSVEPVKYIESRTIYNLGHIITLPNGTQLYQSNTGHIQLISQPGAPI